MAPILKLSYFDTAGRAEPIRLALTYAGIEFEDYRFPRDQWPTVKATTPFGQVPVLTVDGKQVAQSTAILRYVAKLAPASGLYPTDDFQALKVDEYLNVLEDMGSLLRPSMYEADVAKKLEMRKALLAPEGSLTQLLANFEKALSQSGKGYAVGSSPTIADLAIFGRVAGLKTGNIDGISVNHFDQYPSIKAIHENIEKEPKLQTWFQAHKA
ncbi:cytochrome c oxidase subunit 1 [Thoreauomyces humboldtii]|nr:cytochrome c oxidase subunit 1 [Thoreauomyces humboldtii]